MLRRLKREAILGFELRNVKDGTGRWEGANWQPKGNANFAWVQHIVLHLALIEEHAEDLGLTLNGLDYKSDAIDMQEESHAPLPGPAKLLARRKADRPFPYAQHMLHYALYKGEHSYTYEGHSSTE